MKLSALARDGRTCSPSVPAPAPEPPLPRPAGSLSPDCEEIFQEGIIVPPVRIARDGHFNDELLRVFVRNSRFPAMVQGDTRASIAAIRLGDRRLIKRRSRRWPSTCGRRYSR